MPDPNGLAGRVEMSKELFELEVKSVELELESSSFSLRLLWPVSVDCMMPGVGKAFWKVERAVGAVGALLSR